MSLRSRSVVLWIERLTRRMALPRHAACRMTICDTTTTQNFARSAPKKTLPRRQRNRFTLRGVQASVLLDGLSDLSLWKTTVEHPDYRYRRMT
jgi:hypothetical protein